MIGVVAAIPEFNNEIKESNRYVPHSCIDAGAFFCRKSK